MPEAGLAGLDRRANGKGKGALACIDNALGRCVVICIGGFLTEAEGFYLR